MGSHIQLADDNVPPIFLLIDNDPESREMYSMFLESSGMWVAPAPDPRVATETLIELKPDLIVADLGFDVEEPALEFARSVKQEEATAHIPIVMLSGRTATQVPSGRSDADLFLVKPVLPDDLAGHIGTLLQRSRELRARNQTVMQRASNLVQRSNPLIAKSREIDARRQSIDRRCPSCAQRLQWVETGRIDGTEYDYYHWCDRGCGLFCYDRSSERWVKLAG